MEGASNKRRHDSRDVSGTADVEIICPVKEAKFLAEITKPQSTILPTLPSIFAHLSTLSRVPPVLSHVRLNQSIRWQGSHIDFSSFADKTCLTDRVLLLQKCFYTLGDLFLWPSHRQEK